MLRADRAVVLAAGLGTRLKWLTRQQPKALMRVAGEPVIGLVIRRLTAQGVRDIAVNTHCHAEQLLAYLGDGSRFGCRIAISHEPELLDSGGGVRQALSRLPGGGLVVVHNADVLADIDIHRLAALAPAGGSSIALVENPAHHPDGDFALNDSDVSMNVCGRLTFAGISVWDGAAFDCFRAGEAFSLAYLIRQQVAAGICKGAVHPGYWFDIGRPIDLMRARRRLG
jgi:MurNAc alpha-1-phosphate uridylyltransferase